VTLVYIQAVDIATGYGLDEGRVGSSSPGRVKNFLYVVQTGAGAHLASYPVDTGGFFSGIKRQGREGSFCLAFAPKFYMHFSSPSVLHALPISSQLT
jgi:hypothetical protein